MNIFTAKWPFYVAGLLLPVLIVLGLFCFDSVLGLSESWLAIFDYIEDGSKGLPPLNWQTGLLGGIFLGALIGSVASDQFKCEVLLPDSGSSGGRFVRTLATMVGGGFLLMAGSLLAGEVPFGQLAAAVQLSPGGWLYLAGFLATACFLSIIWAQKSGGGKSPAKGGAETKGARKSAGKN